MKEAMFTAGLATLSRAHHDLLRPRVQRDPIGAGDENGHDEGGESEEQPAGSDSPDENCCMVTDHPALPQDACPPTTDEGTGGGAATSVRSADQYPHGNASAHALWHDPVPSRSGCTQCVWMYGMCGNNRWKYVRAVENRTKILLTCMYCGLQRREKKKEYYRCQNWHWGLCKNEACPFFHVGDPVNPRRRSGSLPARS